MKFLESQRITPWLLIISLMFFAAFQALDVLTTLISVSIYGLEAEANVIVRNIIASFGPEGLWIVKGFCVFLMAFPLILNFSRKHLSGFLLGAFSLLNLLYLLVVVSNLRMLV